MHRRHRLIFECGRFWRDVSARWAVRYRRRTSRRMRRGGNSAEEWREFGRWTNGKGNDRRKKEVLCCCLRDGLSDRCQREIKPERSINKLTCLCEEYFGQLADHHQYQYHGWGRWIVAFEIKAGWSYRISRVISVKTRQMIERTDVIFEMRDKRGSCVFVVG